MIYTQNISGAFNTVVGKDGATEQDFIADLADAGKAIGVLQEHKKNNSLPVLNVASRKDDLKQIEEIARHITGSFDTLVVLGMGASGRGGSTLVALAKNPFTGLAGKTKIHFIENIDPFTFEQFMASASLKTTMFLAISKSGSTAETMAQLLVLLEAVEKKAGKKALKEHFLFIADPGDNPMRRLGSALGITMLDHDPKIGGRFAALTAVGLLPAKVAGLDIHAIRLGAEEVISHTFTGAEPEPAKGAAINNALLRKGKSVSVLMPYCDRLHEFGAWYQQLWAESLGKKGRGTTALRSLGATDQHSQLQLYLDGPHDKFMTMILLNQENTGNAIPPSNDKALGYLKNHTIGDLMVAEQIATAKTLTRNNCPLRTLTLDSLNEHSIGALMMHFMLETMIVAQLWNIDAFDQPAVEEGKQLAREYLANAA